MCPQVDAKIDLLLVCGSVQLACQIEHLTPYVKTIAKAHSRLTLSIYKFPKKSASVGLSSILLTWPSEPALHITLSTH